MRYAWLALRYGFGAQLNRKFEFFAGAMAMILNNIVYFGGVSLFLFHGRPENGKYLSYYLGVQAVVAFAWGALNFLTRGFRELGNYIESGYLETFLARPKNPLLLAAFSKTDVTAAGDLLQGIAMVPVCGYLFGVDFAVRVVFGSLIATLGFYALMVFAGSLAFLVSRGAALSDLVLQASLNIIMGWPIGPKLRDLERICLLLTPIGAAILLPMDAIWTATIPAWCAAVVGAIISALLATGCFFLGLRNFQSTNFVRVGE